MQLLINLHSTGLRGGGKGNILLLMTMHPQTKSLQEILELMVLGSLPDSFLVSALRSLALTYIVSSFGCCKPSQNKEHERKQTNKPKTTKQRHDFILK